MARPPFDTVQAIATDYDETIAEAGYVPRETLRAMERFRATGRLLILDTGRGMEDLLTVFPEVHRFDWIVAENGAVLFHPPTGKETLLAQPLPDSFFRELRRRGVSPLPKRRVILDTWAEHRGQITEAMHAAHLDLHMIFNKDTVLVLPRGVDKASGLRHALAGTGISLSSAAGIGDAENDHALLDCCGLKVAVPHAIPALLRKADQVMTFRELVDEVLIQ